MKLDEDSESERSEIPGDHECEEKVYLQAERANLVVQVADVMCSVVIPLCYLYMQYAQGVENFAA